MKFRTDPKSFWKMIALSVGMAAMSLFLVSLFSAISPLRLILIIASGLAPTFFMLTIGRSMMSSVTIDANGVVSQTFGKTNGIIRWEQMAEVGIGTLEGTRKGRYFLYFVTIPLTEQQRFMINRMKHNDNAIWMQLTEEAVELVETYYHGQIHAMSLLLTM